MKHWKLSDYLFIVSANRLSLHRIFFSMALLSLAFDWNNHMLISQIGANPLLNQDVDPVYLFFMSAGIAGFISGSFAPYFDSLVIVTCLASLIWPRHRLWPAVFAVCYFVYFVISNMLGGHHYTNIGIMIPAMVFVFRSQWFAGAFALCRFFFCFMMFSAACWKIARGNLWHVDQTYVMLVSTHLDELASGNTTGTISLVKWLIMHPYMAHSIWIMLILLEAVFIVGFFSLRWDKWLFACYLLFFAGGWILFHIYNFENLIFLLTLSPVSALINRLNKAHRQKTI